MELPSALGADITSEQEKVLIKGLAIKIEERYSTINELKAAFIDAKKENEQKIDSAVKKSTIKNY